MSEERYITELYKRQYREDNDSESTPYNPDYENDSVPLIADGHIFVSRKEFKRRTDIKEGTLSRFRQMDLIPRSSYVFFDHYNPPESRYYEEYVNLIEQNKDRFNRFSTIKSFYEFIKQKWERHRNELIKEIPTEWN